NQTFQDKDGKTAHAADVWIVDDNPGDVLLIQMALERLELPCHLKVISNGEDALRQVNALETEPSIPDIILLDINLPRVSGMEVLRALRSHSAGSQVRVAVVSSSPRSNDQDLAKIGADRYLQKPVELKAFLRGIARLVRDLWPAAPSTPQKVPA